MELALVLSVTSSAAAAAATAATTANNDLVTATTPSSTEPTIAHGVLAKATVEVGDATVGAPCQRTKNRLRKGAPRSDQTSACRSRSSREGSLGLTGRREKEEEKSCDETEIEGACISGCGGLRDENGNIDVGFQRDLALVSRTLGALQHRSCSVGSTECHGQHSSSSSSPIFSTSSSTSSSSLSSSSSSSLQQAAAAAAAAAAASAPEVVATVEALKSYIRREGSLVGEECCLWADDFAHAVVAQHLNLCILFIDMERSSGSNPYRILATAERPERVVILKRQGWVVMPTG
jgi:hypothetical protein